MREKPKIPEERLRACLQDQYELSPVTLEFLPLGLDSNAGVYQVVSEQGAPYLLKVKSGSLYEPGCLVPSYLRNQGIPAVVAPVPTKDQALWTRAEDWTVIVYPFLTGETSWTGMTDDQWKTVGTIFHQIHQVRMPPEGFASLRQEIFDPAGYARWVRAFEAQHIEASGGEVPPSAHCTPPGWRTSPPSTRSSPRWKSWQKCSKREPSPLSSVTQICIQPICSVIPLARCLCLTGMR
jgi:spectinomycin phosphotransferase